MRIRIGLVMAMLALAGCTTTRFDGVSSGQSGLSPKSGGIANADGEGARTILSAMDGGLVGSLKSVNLSAADRNSALEAEYRALEYTPNGQAVSWQGGNGTGGEVTAAQPYRVGSQDCRQYSHVVTAGTAKQTARGTACRNSDGSWTPLT